MHRINMICIKLSTLLLNVWDGVNHYDNEIKFYGQLHMGIVAKWLSRMILYVYSNALMKFWVAIHATFAACTSLHMCILIGQLPSVWYRCSPGTDHIRQHMPWMMWLSFFKKTANKNMRFGCPQTSSLIILRKHIYENEVAITFSTVLRPNIPLYIFPFPPKWT